MTYVPQKVQVTKFWQDTRLKYLKNTYAIICLSDQGELLAYKLDLNNNLCTLFKKIDINYELIFG